MIKVISFKICPFVQRVTALLEAKKIPYEIEYISLSNKPEWFIDISPNGQVPVLVSEKGIPLFESDAIIEYIADEYGPVEQRVSNEQRALDRAWSYLGSKNYLAQCSAMSSKDGKTFKERADKLTAVFAKVERQLTGGTRFFKSNNLSQVDIAWLPLLHRALIIKQNTGFDFLYGLPKVKAWQKSIVDLEYLNKTVSENFETLFKDFYLTNTYLSGGNTPQKTSTCGTRSCCG